MPLWSHLAMCSSPLSTGITVWTRSLRTDTLAFVERIILPMPADTDRVDDLTGRYEETDTERRIIFEANDQSVVVGQNLDGYAMLTVRTTVDGPELERYYGLDMALDHAAEVLGVDPTLLPVPEAGADMGM